MRGGLVQAAGQATRGKTRPYNRQLCKRRQAAGAGDPYAHRVAVAQRYGLSSRYPDKPCYGMEAELYAVP